MTSPDPGPHAAPGCVATESGAPTGGQKAPLAECETDPLSVRGLRRLATDDAGWRSRLREAWRRPEVRAEVRLARSEGATLRAVILAFVFELRGGRRPARSVETVRKARQVLQAVVEVAGDWPVEGQGIDWDELRALLTEPHCPDSRARLSRDRASRALSLVEKALARRAEKLALPPVARPSRTGSTPTPPRPGRYSVPLKACAALLRAARPGERVKIGLALGLGFMPGEVDRLRGGDVVAHTVPRELASREVPPGFRTAWVRSGGRGGLVRWTPAPLWVVALLDGVPLGKDGAPLIGPAEAPTLSATVRRLRGQVPGLDELKAVDLCLTWQAVALRLGLRREVVRRTWGQHLRADRRTEWHPAQRELVWLAARWPTLMCDATRGLVDRGELVPRRAPAGCPADQPERGWRSRKRDTPPLPAGVIRPVRR